MHSVFDNHLDLPDTLRCSLTWVADIFTTFHNEESSSHSMYSADFTNLPIFSLPDTKCSMTFKCGQQEMALSHTLRIRQVRLSVRRFSLRSFGRLHDLPAGKGVISLHQCLSTLKVSNHCHCHFPLLPIFRLPEKILAYSYTGKDTDLHDKRNHPYMQHMYEEIPNSISSARASAIEGKHECLASLKYFQDSFTVSHPESHVSTISHSL